MTALNHAVTGSIIGFILSNPFLALIFAFLSHFILDMIPHFGNKSNKNWIKTKTFRYFLIIDIFLTIDYGLLILFIHPDHYILSFWCAFIATSPDLAYLKGFIYSLRNKVYKPGRIVQLFAKIQQSESYYGIIIELTYLFGALNIANIYLKLF